MILMFVPLAESLSEDAAGDHAPLVGHANAGSNDLTGAGLDAGVEDSALAFLAGRGVSNPQTPPAELACWNDSCGRLPDSATGVGAMVWGDCTESR